ncbi:MAG: hypothetical protein OEW08_08995 [Gammaproteobacteria bacterium]|nr:hypothetical protein [Gammaproteobacteria bacterium]
MWRVGWLYVFGWWAGSAFAVEGQVVDVEFKHSRGDQWQVSTLVSHPNTSWTDFIDRWRVVSDEGHVLGEKFLNPEQIALGDYDKTVLTVGIPHATTVVFVEIHDSVKGWGKARVKVDLGRHDGPRFRVRR